MSMRSKGPMLLDDELPAHCTAAQRERREKAGGRADAAQGAGAVDDDARSWDTRGKPLDQRLIIGVDAEGMTAAFMAQDSHAFF